MINWEDLFCLANMYTAATSTKVVKKYTPPTVASSPITTSPGLKKSSENLPNAEKPITMQGMQAMFQNIQEIMEKNQESIAKSFDDLKTEISGLRGEIVQIKETLGEVKTTILEHEERLIEVEKNSERVEIQIDKCEKKYAQAVGKIEDEIVFLEMEKSAFFLRLQNVVEDKEEQLDEIVGEIIAEVVGRRKEEVCGNIDEAYRVYTNYARRHKLPREVHVRLTKKTLRDETLHKARDQSVTYKGQQITILKQIPRRVREQRHNYQFITSQLRKHNAPYRWLLPEGLLVTWQERKIKIESIYDAQDFCETYFGHGESERETEVVKERQRDQREEWRKERGAQVEYGKGKRNGRKGEEGGVEEYGVETRLAAKLKGQIDRNEPRSEITDSKR